MSTWPSPSALDPRTQAFPVLTPAQIARLRPGGKLRKVEPGDILFRPDDTEVPFFVLLSGGMEIVQPDLTGERAIATHGPGGFTGEITMISGPRPLLLRRLTPPGDFLSIPPHTFRAVGGEGAATIEDFMRAFILRRLALITSRFGNVIVV